MGAVEIEVRKLKHNHYENALLGLLILNIINQNEIKQNVFCCSLLFIIYIYIYIYFI
jgi:hypothetical protein